MRSIHRVEYYAGMKGSEALTQATVWMDRGYTILRERSRHGRTLSGSAWAAIEKYQAGGFSNRNRVPTVLQARSQRSGCYG